MDKRNAMIDDYQSGLFSITELAQRYGVTRDTVYKWTERFSIEGRSGLEDRSSAPKSCPHRLERCVEELILSVRRRHPGWGAKKILQAIALRQPELKLPARSTANDVLGRHALLSKRPQRQPREPSERPVTTTGATANDRFAIDFKGQFRLGNGRYCYPLTMTDEHTRYLLVCTALDSTETGPVRRELERVFRKYGLPERIRSDNGSPFAGNGRWGLSQLNVWWIQLGISHEPGRPACPQDNARHERMHRTLKQETTRPPQMTMRAQQQCFDRFRSEYNDERPHDALGGRPPGMLWQPSMRPYPSRLVAPEYHGHWEVRRVSTNGTIKFKNAERFLSVPLHGLQVGLEEIDDDLWNIWLYARLLGRLNTRTGQVR
jgi:transposase InsO family protein